MKTVWLAPDLMHNGHRHFNVAASNVWIRAEPDKARFSHGTEEPGTIVNLPKPLRGAPVIRMALLGQSDQHVYVR